MWQLNAIAVPCLALALLVFVASGDLSTRTLAADVAGTFLMFLGMGLLAISAAAWATTRGGRERE